jgi:hypothetical protein
MSLIPLLMVLDSNVATLIKPNNHHVNDFGSYCAACSSGIYDVGLMINPLLHPVAVG